MMAEHLYESHRRYAATLGIELPEWAELTPSEMVEWDDRAFEQTCRDRPLPENLQGVESYDPYTF